MSIATALKAYRISAWVTGVGLLLLTFYAMPAKYFFGDPRPVALIGMIHGFLWTLGATPAGARMVDDAVAALKAALAR